MAGPELIGDRTPGLRALQDPMDITTIIPLDYLKRSLRYA